MKCNKTLSEFFDGCLYFSANRFARIITELADEEFMPTGLSPSLAFALMLVNNGKEITPMELGKLLHLAPSTLTRFIDKLEAKGLVSRTHEGKNSIVRSTKKGLELQPVIEKAWSGFYTRYSSILGEKLSQDMTAMLRKASLLVEEKRFT